MSDFDEKEYRKIADWEFEQYDNTGGVLPMAEIIGIVSANTGAVVRVYSYEEDETCYVEVWRPETVDERAAREADEAEREARRVALHEARTAERDRQEYERLKAKFEGSK